MLNRTFLIALALLISAIAFAQPGKDGALTISTNNTVLNRYTRVTSDVAIGSNSVTVFDINELSRDGIGYLPTGYNTNSSSFASNTLATGDLILLFQAQGAQINNTNSISYGEVNNLNNAGKYELAYVQSVSGNTIFFDCKTRFSYFSSNYVQVIRVPQYTTLTVNNGASVVPIPWGSPFFGGSDPSATTRRRGGFVSIIANSIVNNGSINANAAGFRGGTILNGSAPSGDGYYPDFFYNVTMRGGEKGESIAGYRPDYDALGGRYGRGAPANGGGGGNSHNCGGGGGANGGNASGWFRGAGVMNDFGTCGNPGAWTLDPNYIANGNALTNSTGGGQGGYSYSADNANACSNGPSYPIDFIATGSPSTNVLTTAWDGDQRKAFGGFGGRPLISPAIDRQIFFGGGGGAGDGNNDANNDGGDGGGIIFLIVENAVTGTGAIQANGEGALSTRGNGNDSPGGGGGGGTILVQSSSIASSITINANGGRGGSQNISFATEAEGPGGGGGGGAIYINASSDASTKTVNGGANGITNSPSLTEFIANGATSGNTGSISTTVVYINFNECLADLSIIKTASNMNPAFGSNITFTLTANNEGQNDATNVIVSDILNSGYTFVSATPSKGTFNNVTGQWSIGNLVYPETATLQIIATVKATGVYSNTATITNDNPDPVTTNNTSIVTPVPTNCTVGIASSTPTLCINSTLTQITHSTTVATGIGTAVGLPSGLSATWASNQVRINGTPTQSGVFNYSIPLTSTCGNLSASGTITVNTNTVASTSTQTICRNVAMTSITRATTGATGRGTATGLPPGVTSSWAGNVLTISGTPTTNGTYNYSIPLTGGCGTVNATGTIIVTNSTLTVSAASSSPTLCRNTSLTPITHTTTNATGIGTPIGLPTGVIALWSSNTITISGSPIATGVFNYSIPLIGACGPVNATGTIRVNGNTVSSASSTPTVCRNVAMTAVTHTTTGATGRGTVAGLPPGVTANWASNVLTISGTPTTVGTYVYTIPLTGGCVTEQAVGTITVVNASTVANASGGNNRTLCINTALTTITRATTGATGIGTATGLPTGVSASWSANVITVSGTPTQSGTFNYSIPLTGGCNTLNATGTITVNAANTVSAASSSPTLCISTAMTAITHNTTGATGRGTATGLPTGLNSAWAANVLTISGTPTQSGTFNYSIPLTGGCVTTPATGTIVVTANKTPGTVSSNPTLCINTALTAITRTTTGATGIGTATGLPTGVSASWSANTLTVSGTPTQSGTFNYSIPLTGGCGTVNATGTITVTVNNTVGNASGGNNRTVCINSVMTSISRTTTGATGIGTATGLPTGISAAWSGNTLTVSGTPTQSGTFNYSIPLTGGCGAINATGTITVTTLNTVGAASSTPTSCIYNALSNITHTTTGATGISNSGVAGANGLPSGVAASWASNTITISGTPWVSGTFNYTIPLTGGCGSVSATGTIIIKATPTGNFSYSNYGFCSSVNTAQAITSNFTDATGTFSAAAGLNLNSSTGGITPSLSSPNVYVVTYSVPASTGCPSYSTTTNVTIDQAGSGIITYNPSTLCLNASGTLSPTITNDGGSGSPWFTVSPNGLNINNSGVITPVGSVAGTYTITYNRPSSGLCNAYTNSTTVTLSALATAGAASSTPTLCINSALTNITHSTTGAIGIGTATGLPAGVSAAWSNNVITVSGTPTASGIFNYSIPLTGGCGTVNATGTITVNAQQTVSVASSSPTICRNVSMASITHSTTGATGRGTATGLPPGVSSSWAANVLTISGTPTTAGTYNYSIPLTGGCGSVSATGTITVSVNNTVGNASGGNNRTACINSAITTISRTTTGATGIGTPTGLPTGVSAAWSNNVITISGTPTQSGTFNYSIPLMGGCGSINATGTITVTANNTVGNASGGNNRTVCVNSTMTTISRTTTRATGIGTPTGLPTGVSASWSTNTLTISGTPTQSGTFNYSVPLTGGCGTINATGTITVTAANTAGVASSSPTLCINTALTAITHATTGATGRGTATGLPTGVTSSWSANVLTISGTPSQTGTFNYSIPLTGGCGAVSATGTITVSVNNTVGNASGGNNRTACINSAITTISRTTTGATGIGTPTGLPNGVTASWSNDVITVSGTPTASGSFNYSIPLIGGCGSINATGTITVTAVPTGTISGGTTVCSGTNSTTLTLGGTFTGTNQWQSSLDNNTFNDIANATSTTYTAVNLTSTTYYRAMITNGVCSSSTTTVETITVSSAETPTISITQQPNCTTATGEIQITSSPIGLTFSVNGSTYQSGTIFSSLIPGLYNVTAKNSVGCISAPVNATINAQPTVPNPPIATNLSSCVYNLPGSYVTDVNGFNSPYFKWYTTSTGDTTSASYLQRSTATSYQQFITATTTYYVSVVHPIGNCESARTLVLNAVIDPLEAYIPFTNDYIWKGGAVADDNNWNTVTNWYQWDGTKYITVNTIPGLNDNVYITPTGICTPAQPSIQNENTQQFINLFIIPGGTLTVEGNGILNVSGNWENNGTFVSGNGVVNFVGAGNHAISGSTNTTFYDVNINKPVNGTSKSVLTLEQQIFITGQLNLNSGLLDIATYNLDMGNRSITGGSAASYVRTSSSGFLRRIVGSNAANDDGSHVRFPIGRSNYNPAHLDNSGTNETFSLRVYDLVSDNADEFGTMTTLPVVERTWLVEEEIAGGSNVDMKLYWNGTLENRIEELNSFDYNTAYIAHYEYDEVTWENKGGNAPNGPGYAQQNGITDFSPFTISSEGGLGWSSALPVELLDFTATCLDDESVQIYWSTASENNSSHFEVRKSLDGYTWNTLETVAAAGNSTELLEYAVLDRSLTKGNAYYRLNQIDIDGKSELFEVVNTNCDEKINTNLLTTYPNPSSTEFFVDFNSENIEGKGELTIMDARGVVVYSKNVLVEKGNNFYTIDAIKVLPGIYYVKLSGENFSTNVVKQTIN
jgi:hypothetical protein